MASGGFVGTRSPKLCCSTKKKKTVSMPTCCWSHSSCAELTSIDIAHFGLPGKEKKKFLPWWDALAAMHFMLPLFVPPYQGCSFSCCTALPSCCTTRQVLPSLCVRAEPCYSDSNVPCSSGPEANFRLGSEEQIMKHRLSVIPGCLLHKHHKPEG